MVLGMVVKCLYFVIVIVNLQNMFFMGMFSIQ